MLKILVALAVFLLSVCQPAFATVGVVQLPQTGQTMCYDSSGVGISCSGTGQNGELSNGIAWPAPRFVDNMDGTISDSLTGLMWLKDANCIKTQYPSFDKDGEGGAGNGKVTWKHGLDFVAGINSWAYQKCGPGHTDWRLPNINELESLFNAGQADSASWLASQGFENVQQDYYWSSSGDSDETDRARVVHMQNGYVNVAGHDQNFYAWPVRSDPGKSKIWKTGQTKCYNEAGGKTNCKGTQQDGSIKAGVAWPAVRFKDNYDGTVTDTLTGLAWLKDANCISTQYPGFDEDDAAGDGEVVWQHALDFVAGINNGTFPNCGAGRTDWRLPDRKELYSLIDSSKEGPALPSGYPFINLSVQDYYWTSTSRLDNPALAWEVSMRYGYVYSYYKNGINFVWPVRSVSDEEYSAPNISVISPSAENLDFGSIKKGKSKSLSLVLKNTGMTDLTLSSMDISGQDSGSFSVKNTKAIIKPDKTLKITVKFAPKETGGKSAILTITSDDPDTQEAEISLTGTAK